MRMKQLHIILLLIFLSAGLHAQNTDSWTIFRGEPNLSGTTQAKIPDKPRLKWTYKTGDNIKSAPVISNGKIVVGSTDGVVYCLDTNGSLIWKFTTSNSVEAPALIHENTVYIGNLDGMLYAIDLVSGKEKWSYETENQIIGSANWWSDGKTTWIFFGSYDFFLHCVDASTGEVKWKYESDNFINGAPAVFQGKAYFGGCDGFLHIVDVATGKLHKKIDVATYVAGSVAVE